MKKMSLNDLTKMICDVIVARAKNGQDFGIVLLPESLLLAVPQTRHLIMEIEGVLATLQEVKSSYTIIDVASRLKPWTATIFDALPHDVQEELVFNTTQGSSPKVDLANVSTEWLISTLVSVELDRR